MKTKYILLIFLCLPFIFYFFFIKKNSEKNYTTRNETIIVGTSADYPPFSFVDIKKNEIIGFDIDIIEEVAKRSNKKLVIKDIPFTSLLFNLLSGDIDLIAAGMSPTQKKEENVSFSKSYISQDPFVIITKKSNIDIKNINDLKGKSVTVNTGYTADAYLTNKDGINLVRLATPVESLMALNSGTVDAFVCVRSVTMSILKNQENFSQNFNLFPILEATGDSYAFVLNKDNKKLLEKINTTLDSMISDGTIDKLKEKWNF